MGTRMHQPLSDVEVLYNSSLELREIKVSAYLQIYCGLYHSLSLSLSELVACIR
jgi:hypothetical protein